MAESVHAPTRVPVTISHNSDVLFENLVVTSIVWLFLYVVIEDAFLALLITGAIVGFAYMNGRFGVEVPYQYGRLAYNPLRSRNKAKVLFSGTHNISILDSLGKPESLIKERLHPQHLHGKVLRLPTKDEAEIMEVELMVAMQIDTSGTPQEAAEKFRRFKSIDETTLMDFLYGAAERPLTKYYSERILDKLTDAAKVQDEAYKGSASDEIHAYERRYGVHVTKQVKESRPSEETIERRANAARARSTVEAREILQKDSTGQHDVLDPDKAHRSAMIIDPNNNYNETRNDLNIGIQAPDLKNLTSANIVVGAAAQEAAKPKKGSKK